MARSAWRVLVCLQIIIFSLATLGRAAVHIPGVSAGINKESGERPIRQDIRKFQDAGAAFDLYVLALKQFQDDAHDNVASFYQVAGTCYLVLANKLFESGGGC